MKKYSRLYNDLKEQIITGQLTHGDKIPSVRKAALIYSVSTTTVQNAYFELCADGYIVSKEKSGYFVSYIKSQNKIKNETENETNIEYIDRNNTITTSKYDAVPILKKVQYTKNKYDKNTSTLLSLIILLINCLFLLKVLNTKKLLLKI